MAYCGHQTFEPKCRKCELAATRQDYRKIWGLSGPPPGLPTNYSPNFFKKAISFIKTMYHQVIAGNPNLNALQYQERLQICKKCPYYNNNACAKCGCGDLQLKARLATAECPDRPSRWPLVVIK